jgi:hypothetical protein
MRLNAERERITKFKSVVKESAESYYHLLADYQKLVVKLKA